MSWMNLGVFSMATVHMMIIVFAFFLYAHVSTVNGENPLMGVICDATEAPTTCFECMKSDPRNDHADEVLLAVIVVDCAITHAELLRGNMSTWASKANDQLYKAALEDCTTWFSYARDDLFAATLGLMKGDFDGADRSVYNASMRSVACGRRRTKSVRAGLIESIPMEVSYELGIYNQLTHAAMKTINSL